MKQSAADASYEEYMKRVGRETIPCYEPSLGEEEIACVTDALRSGWLSERKYTRAFERKLAALCGRQHAIAFCNATSALIAGMKALDIGPGDEVIVPSFAHPADPNAIAATGATPVFADVDRATLCLSAATIEAVRTAQTKAILLISVYGNTPDIDTLAVYAREHNLFLIHDCAAALGTVFRGKPAASYGDFSVLSFFADKTITTGEGGMLLADDAALIAGANIYKHDGRKERGVDVIERRGYNFRITELQAAVGVAQLGKLARFMQRKQEIRQAYADGLAGISDVVVFPFSPEAKVVPHRIIIFVPDAASLIASLEKQGIGVRTLFMPMHSQPCYGVQKRFPVTETLFRTGVCLPSAPSLTAENIKFICGAIRAFYGT